MYVHNLDPILFNLGFIAIRWYSLAYIFGILLGWWLGIKIISKKFIIEDLILAAHNNAKSKVKSKTKDEIAKTTGGFGIPGFKWPL